MAEWHQVWASRRSVDTRVRHTWLMTIAAERAAGERIDVLDLAQVRVDEQLVEARLRRRGPGVHELRLRLGRQAQGEDDLLQRRDLRGEDLAALDPADRAHADPGQATQVALGEPALTP